MLDDFMELISAIVCGVIALVILVFSMIGVIEVFYTNRTVQEVKRNTTNIELKLDTTTCILDYSIKTDINVCIKKQ